MGMVKGYGRYTDAYKQAAVTTTDQARLIVMLYDGAIKFLTLAADRIEKRDSFGANTNLIKGKSIIAELMASLNLEKGGDIARNLQRLYAYMFNQLIEANVLKDPGKVSHVLGLLRELRAGWQSIPAAGKGEPKAAPPAGAGTKPINLRG
jgi:flagellar protein FliS